MLDPLYVSSAILACERFSVILHDAHHFHEQVRKRIYAVAIDNFFSPNAVLLSFSTEEEPRIRTLRSITSASSPTEYFLPPSLEHMQITRWNSYEYF